MIKARLGGTLFLGLEARNIEKLKLDQPILVSRKEADNGSPIEDVVIFYGDTKADMLAMLKKAGLVREDMEVDTDPPPARKQ